MIVNEDVIRKACSTLADILVKKNHDYGNSVEEQYKEYGDTSLHLRIEDKLRRVKNLAKQAAQVPEKEAETYLDAAGYSILAYILKTYEEIDPLDLPVYMKPNINFEDKPLPVIPYFDPDDQH